LAAWRCITTVFRVFWCSAALVISRSRDEPLWRSAALAISRSGDQSLWRSAALVISRSGDQPLWRSVALAISRSGDQLLWRSAALAIKPVAIGARTTDTRWFGTWHRQHSYLSIYWFSNDAHISQPFSGGIVLYIYLHHITWSWPRTLVLMSLCFFCT
jgi:hypothetical protein